MEHKHYHKPEEQEPWWKTNSGMVLIVFLALGGYFLIKEHAAHIGQNWVYLILLLCPLMHFFMHGSHGGHGGHGHNHDKEED